ncbi:hypothetical protein EPV75_05495 [Hydrogenovibrio thermophilus]|uniref:Uncharacterized protein n=1 Tax=Hydrogenovibrio thermophilus TaxID=265883 RepID=A0A410H695_9GAMM|nr:hypothetical protein EPV75_05495 [Hydrogenovibrio thermophilus]
MINKTTNVIILKCDFFGFRKIYSLRLSFIMLSTSFSDRFHLINVFFGPKV